MLVSEINGENTRQLANDIAWTIPIVQWSSDSLRIYYPVSKEMELMTVESINVITRETQEHGQFTMGSGCGGYSPDPANHTAAGENITSGGSGVAVFTLSPNEKFIVHTTNCMENGLGVLDLSTKQDRQLDDIAETAAISPDGKSIAAVTENKSLVNFSTN